MRANLAGGIRQEPEVAVVATLFPRVQEPAKGGDGENGEKNRPVKDASNGSGVISTALKCKKRRPAPTGSAAEAVDDRGEENIGSCAFTDVPQPQVPQVFLRGRAVATRHDRGAAKRGCETNGEEAGVLIKKRCRAAAAICEGGTAALYQMNRQVHSMKPPSPRIEEEGVTSQFDRKIMKRPSKSISTAVGSEDSYISGFSAKLKGMGVSISDVTQILEKELSASDCNAQSRLLLPKSFKDLPLLHMLTGDEDRLAHTGNSKDDGLPVLTLDRHGRSYHMKFKYLESNRLYRLIGQWGKLVAQNGMRSGDKVKLGAFRRVDGQLMLTLLHFGKAYEASKSKETEASKEELTSRDTEVSKTSMVTEVGKEGFTSRGTSRETLASKEWSFREAEVGKVEGSSTELEVVETLKTEVGKEEWSSKELEVVEALLILRGVEDDTKQ